MKLTVHQISEGENELILKYLEINDEVERALDFMNGYEKKLVGEKGVSFVASKDKKLVNMSKASVSIGAYTEYHPAFFLSIAFEIFIIAFSHKKSYNILVISDTRRGSPWPMS